MSNRYRVSGKNTNAKKINTGIQKDAPLIGKGKILAILTGGTFIVAGVYIAAMKMHFLPIFHIYWIITAVLLCVFAFSTKRCEQLYMQNMGKDGKMSEGAKSEHLKRTKKVKYLLLVLLPFLFTVIGDTVYVLILQDSGIFEAIKNLFAV